MVCEKFIGLTVKERIEFHGKLIHAVLNDEKMFELAERIIELGEIKGLFENVKINPGPQQNTGL